MKLFGRSSGYYLFWAGFIYFWVGMYLAFTHTGHTEYVSLGFVLALSVPLWCPPVARYFNMEPIMFNLFDKKDKESNNVVKFPDHRNYGVDDKHALPLPEKKKEPKEHYRVGFNDEGMTTLTLMSDGYSTTLSMNKSACEQMIKMLRSTYRDDHSPDDDPDGGLPLPVEDKKVA